MDNLPVIINVFKYGFSIVLLLTGIIMLAISLYEKASWREFLFSWPAGMSSILIITSIFFYFFTNENNILVQMKTITTAFTLLYAIYASKHKLFMEDKETGKRYFTKIGYIGIVFIFIISTSSVSADFLKGEIDRQVKKHEAEEEFKQKRKMEIRIARVLKDVDLTKGEAKQLNEQINNYIVNISKKITLQQKEYSELKQKYDMQVLRIDNLKNNLKTALKETERYRNKFEKEQVGNNNIKLKLNEEKFRCELIRNNLKNEKEKFALLQKELKAEKNSIKNLRKDLEKAQQSLITQRTKFDKSIKNLNEVIKNISLKIDSPVNKIQELYLSLKKVETSLIKNQSKK